MTRRAVPEWIGKTPDSAIPARVRRRVFDRHRGICQITGRKIMPGDKWDCDHIRAICNGGQNREFNLQPAILKAHRAKTREDVKQKAVSDRIRKKHLGIRTTKRPMLGSRDHPSGLKKRLDGTVVPRN